MDKKEKPTLFPARNYGFFALLTAVNREKSSRVHTKKKSLEIYLQSARFDVFPNYWRKTPSVFVSNHTEKNLFS